jgi:tetratricopeptide (TPR) repeat protein
VALDRDETLRKAERLLRQGRLDSAIAEYVRLVDAQPRDWATANALGDLYVRTAQLDKAVSQFARIADQLFREGFLPKAAALYKKVLKISPDDEAAQLQLAEVSARQGLYANARTYFTAVADQRRWRGDRAGADAVLQRMASIDPADLDGRAAAARLLAENGDIGGVEQLRAIASELEQQGRQAEAIELLRDVTRFDPSDTASHTRIARACLANGAVDTAREHLTPDAAVNDPTLLLGLAEIELRAGALDQARATLQRALEAGVAARGPIERLGLSLRQENPEGAFVCAEAVADSACRAGDFSGARDTLREFTEFAPAHEAALVRLVEVCVEGGFATEMTAAQVALADACLAKGRATDARVIVDDLLAAFTTGVELVDRRRRIRDALIESSDRLPFSSTTDVAHDANPSYTDTQTAPPAEPPKPAAGRVSQGPEGEWDLTEQLAALAADQEASSRIVEVDAGPDLAAGSVSDGGGAAVAPPLEEVFQGFRDEVSRHRSEEVAAQQYKLAIAYREMGMLDEAAAALQIAARSLHHRFEAAAMLADVFFERQRPTAAIEWLERAAETPPSSASEGQALLYKLGSTLASQGEPARALAVFLELQADAGEYRDVAERIEALSRVRAGG